MRAPAWYREAVAAHGERAAAGAVTRDAAASAIAALIADHPEFLAAIADRDVGRWVRRHEPRTLLDAALFPLIPAYLDVAVDTPARVADMTIGQLDKAYRIQVNRIRNITRPARRQQQALTKFYNDVRPVMEANPGMTVAEALTHLAAREAEAA
jgi:hypothetical protein